MLTVDEYMALRRLIDSERESEGSMLSQDGPVTAAKRKKSSAYARRYKAAFKRQASKFKKQNGTWKKDGFKRAVRAAHKEAKK